MAESTKTMQRLDRLEAALVHITDVLVLQGERIDVGFRLLREEMQAQRAESRVEREEFREEMRAMRAETHAMREETRAETHAMREETRAMREETRLLREETREETRAMREETRLFREETRDELRQLRESVSDRLDRLIAITLKERTSGIERLAAIEQRLARLEEHAGF